MECDREEGVVVGKGLGEEGAKEWGRGGEEEREGGGGGCLHRASPGMI